MFLLGCRWSSILTPGPFFLRKSESRIMRHILWDSPKWLKRRHAEPADSDSNEDDEEQFGIHEGPADDGEQTDVQDEEEGDVYPLYGEDDSDYGESSSEVTSKLAFGSALMDCQLYLVLWNFGNQGYSSGICCQ